MTFLPVVGRELRVASRRRGTYWTRFAAALLAIGLYVWIWIVVGERNYGATLASNLFGSLSVLAFGYTLLAGVTLTSDCLSEEKREGTLGLLFLTDLKGYDVVLGKLAATSVHSFYRLLAIFPVLAIPLLLGGLTYAEFWRRVLVLTNTLFFSLCAGCFVSALSRHDRRSMAGTLLVILIITGGLPLLGYIAAFRKGGFHYDPSFLLLSSGYSFALTSDASFKVNPQHFWTSVITTHAFGWAFLVLASALAPYSWQDKAIGEKQARRRERWQRWRFGSAEVRRAFRTRLLDINPISWLAGRNRLKPAYVLGALALSGCLWLWLFFKYRSDMLDPTAYIPTAILLSLALKFWVASEASRPLNEDRRSGALELLLSAPLSVDEILRGQFLALKRQFGWAVAVIFMADLAMFWGGLNDRALDSSNFWTLLCLAYMLMFFADLYTLAWLGMWLGLKSRKANWASSGALMRVLVVPSLVFLGLMTTSLLLNFERQFDSENFLLAVWFVICMASDLYFFLWARTNLRREFRTVATQRFDAQVRARVKVVPQVRPEPATEPVKA
ncbi:MAG: ABC transporter permease subunit [Verrucomicrobia bacterium]|nr:ABC transporter permease subunit [Verrucomicrobiota bacterium]